MKINYSDEVTAWRDKKKKGRKLSLLVGKAKLPFKLSKV